MRRSRACWLTGSLVGLLGCGSARGITSDGGAAGQGGAAGMSAFGGAGEKSAVGGSGGSSTIDGGASSCGPRATYGGGETSVTGVSVTAAIVDETGAPVAGQPVVLCGLNICAAPATTDGNGRVSIQTNLQMEKPAFRYGDSVSYAELAIPLLAATTDFTTGGQVLALGKLTGKPGAPLTPGSTATSGDVTLAIPAGAAVGIDTLTYATPDAQMLRAVRIPLTNVGPVLNPVMVGGAPANFALLYGVAPAETPLCPPAKLTVALPHTTARAYNDFGWTPGTAVEFWITTIDVGQTYAPYAGWAKMSDGVVSTDGSSASTSDGALEGFVYLESFAIRKAQ
jgi:hypothetical protein